MKQSKSSSITIMALILMIVGSVDSVRNLPATALFGSSLIFFIVFAAIVFLVPCALVSAELSSTFVKKGGIYGWVKEAFGAKAALFAVWLQWVNTLIWFPTILSFIGGTLAYLISPSLAHNKLYLLSIILGIFWANTLLNLKGVRVSAQFASLCAMFGMVLPMALIIGLGLYWVLSGHHLQVHFTASSMLPHFNNGGVWIALTAIMTSFLGVELATVYAKDVVNPQKNFPKALAYSAIAIVLTMILGSLSIAFVLPQNKISLVTGVMQAFSAFFDAYNFHGILPTLTFLVVLGSVGGMVNWIISPIKGLLLSAQDGQLPQFLTYENKHNVPSVLLIAQAVLVSLVSMVFLLVPSVNGSYWLLTALSTQLYMLMYVMMFVAAIVLKYKAADKERPFEVPGGKKGMWITTLLGLFGCAVTLIVGFFPPEGIDVGGKVYYEILFAGGMILMCLPPLLAFFVQKFKSKEVLPA